MLFTDEIKVDEHYQIVITTGEGLYRYHLGDAVQEKSPKGLMTDLVSWSYASSCMDDCKIHAFQVNATVGASINRALQGTVHVKINYLISAEA